MRARRIMENLPISLSAKMGQCILCFQEYEILMKRMMQQDFVVYGDDPEHLQVKPRVAVRRETLGQLIGEFTNSYFSVTDSAEGTV